MNLLTISFERLVFKPGSEPRERIVACGRLMNESHMIAFSQKRRDGLSEPVRISDEVRAYPTNSKNRWLCIPDAYRLARKILSGRKDMDKWIVTCQDPFETGLVGWLVALTFGIPLHLQVHVSFHNSHYWRESWENKIRFVMAGFILKRAKGIMSVSEDIKDYLVGELRIPREKITVLPIYTDTKSIAMSAPKSDLRKKYPQFGAIILMTSRLVKSKNIFLALDAMGKVIGKHPHSGLIIVGSGPEEAALRRYAKEASLENNVIFEPWTDDAISYYKTSDIFLTTANYEGWGMTIIEAMASGCPVVVTDVGCAKEILINEKNALVVAVGKEEDVVSSLDRFLSDDFFRKTVGQRGQDTVLGFKDAREYPKLYRAQFEKLLSL